MIVFTKSINAEGKTHVILQLLMNIKKSGEKEKLENNVNVQKQPPKVLF